MPLDPNGVGHESGPARDSYDWKDTVRYALSVGATKEVEA